MWVSRKEWNALRLAIFGLAQQIQKMEHRLMAKIDDLVNAVQSETTVEDSVVALLSGVSKQLADLKANADGATATQIQGVIDQINANKQKLADAITANTPAA